MVSTQYSLKLLKEKEALAKYLEEQAKNKRKIEAKRKELEF